MARQGRRVAKRPARDYVFVVLGVAVAVALLVVGVNALRARDGGTVSQFEDVHGLAVDPQDASRLFVATHRGLVVGTNDGNWKRVGPEDDLMGFSAHPTDEKVFWASGHPKFKTIAYHNLGVRKSTDGGSTWVDLALPGVDFHGMTVSPANPDNLWGVYQTKLHRSTDGGQAWREVGPAPTQTTSVTADPADAETLYVTTTRGIQRSGDGGATWSLWSDELSYGLAWSRDATTAYLVNGAQLRISTDGGAKWTTTPLDPKGGSLTHVTVDPQDANRAYAATLQAALFKTEDGGATWTAIKPPV